MSRLGPSHIALSPSNFLVDTIRNTKLEGRHRMDFGRRRVFTFDFLEWCKIWGDLIMFNRVQYCKEDTLIGHEFILLYEMEINSAVEQRPSTSQKADLWKELTAENVSTYVCRLERTANPGTVLNAVSGTEAADYITFSKQQPDQFPNSHILFETALSRPQSLSKVLDICYQVSSHSKSRDYTLQQFNCFFFSWNIVAGLVRFDAGWEEALQKRSQQVVDAVLRDFCTFASSDDQSSNMALVLSGHHSAGRSADTPFVQALSAELQSQVFHESLREKIASVLWAKDRKVAITNAIRGLVERLAPVTEELFIAGTGESNIHSLLKRQTPLDLRLDPAWSAKVEVEFKRLFGLYLGDRMWELFGSALKQTSQTNKQAMKDSQVHKSLSVAQRIRYSQPVLNTQLLGLGWKTIINNAQVAASIDVPDRKSRPIEFAMKTLQNTPKQYSNLSKVASPFVAVAGPGMQSRAASGSPFRIQGLGSNVLSLIGPDLDLQPEEFESQVADELAKSIGIMREADPRDDNPGQLRLATLQLLANLKTKGQELNFLISPEKLWRLGIWYSLCRHLIDSLLKITEEVQAEHEPEQVCQQRPPQAKDKSAKATDCKLTYSKIQDWLLRRIEDLSATGPKDSMRLAEPCRQDLEKAMSEIWSDNRSWQNLRGNIRNDQAQ